MTLGTRPITALQRHSWWAELRATASRRSSLLWLTKQAPGTPRNAFHWSAHRALLALVATPWFLPLVIPLVALMLIQFEGDIPLFTGLMTPHARAHFLEVLWQVEGATVALVLAGSLFAFESFTRHQRTIPLSEYANRSGLTRIFMLAVGAMLAIAVVLAFDPQPGTVPTFWAASAGLLTLGLLPRFFVRALQVAPPTWLHEQRLKDVEDIARTWCQYLMRRRAAEAILRDWLETRPVQLGSPFLIQRFHQVEVSDSFGAVYDIDLGYLEELSKEYSGKVELVATLGEEVWPGRPLLVSTEDVVSKRAIFVVSPNNPAARLAELALQLEEEGIEALHRRSLKDTKNVVSLYRAVWLSLAAESSKYQQPTEGFLTADPLFGSPIERLRNGWSNQLRVAIDQGLDEQARSLLSLLWEVRSATETTRSTDIVRQMLAHALAAIQLASGFGGELAGDVVNAACTFQVQCAEYAIGRLQDDTVVPSDADERDLRILETVIETVAESLHMLSVTHRFGTLLSVDRDLRQVFGFWTTDTDFYEVLLGDAKRRRDAPQQATIRRQIELARKRDELLMLLETARCAIVAWLAHNADDYGPEVYEVVAKLAAAIRDPSMLPQLLGYLRFGAGLLNRWVAFDAADHSFGLAPARGEGLLIEGYAISLVACDVAIPAEPEPWMAAIDVGRVASALEKVSTIDALWAAVGLSEEEVRNRVQRLAAQLRSASAVREEKAREELIRAPLSEQAVQEFIQGVAEGWRERRPIESLALHSQVTIRPVQAAEVSSVQLVESSHLIIKGPFVEDLEWSEVAYEKPEAVGKKCGRRLAGDELDAVIERIRAHARHIPTSGTAPTRVRALLETLRLDGYKPSLVIVPWGVDLGEDISLELLAEDGESLRPFLAGQFDGVVVLRSTTLANACAVDLSAFADIVEVACGEGSEPAPHVDVAEVTKELGQRLVAEGRFTSLPDAPHVLATITSPVRLAVKDPSAAAFTDVSGPPNTAAQSR